MRQASIYLPTLPKPPLEVDAVPEWCWGLSKELERFFRSFSSLAGDTPVSTALGLVGSVDAQELEDGGVIQPRAFVVRLTSANLVSTNIPAINQGTAGRILVLVNIGEFKITLVGQEVPELRPGDRRMLIWNDFISKWVEIA